MRNFTICASIASVLSFIAFIFQPDNVTEKSQFNQIVFLSWIIITFCFWIYFYVFPLNHIAKRISDRLNYTGRYVDSNKENIDILDGELLVETVTWKTTVNLPPFESLPSVAILKDNNNYDEPEIYDIKIDGFKVRIHSSAQAGKWKWRVRGKLLVFVNKINNC